MEGVSKSFPIPAPRIWFLLFVCLLANSKPADCVAGYFFQAGPLNCFPALPACEVSLINRVQNKSLHNKTSFSPWASPWVRFPTAALQFGGRAKAAQSHSSSLEVVTRQPTPTSSSEEGGGACAQSVLDLFSLAGRDGAFPYPYIKPSNTEEVCLGVDQRSLTLLPGFVPCPSGTLQDCQAVSVLSLPRPHLVLAVPQLSTAA